MLSARDLNFRYGDKPVLTNVNLDIRPGGITVLIGPSGTGKTTLLRCPRCWNSRRAARSKSMMRFLNIRGRGINSSIRPGRN